MASDNLIRWLAGAAAVVGVFVALAVCSSGPPQALDLKVASHEVAYAPTHALAVAMTSQKATPRPLAKHLASAATAPRKERIARQLPELPRGGSILAAGAVAASAVFESGSALVRSTKTTTTTSPIISERIPSGARVSAPPQLAALLAARPLRGPPVS